MLGKYLTPDDALPAFRQVVMKDYDLHGACLLHYLAHVGAEEMVESDRVEPAKDSAGTSVQPHLTPAEARKRMLAIAAVQATLHDAVYDSVRLRTGRFIGNLLVCELDEFLTANLFEHRLLTFIKRRVRSANPRARIREVLAPAVVYKAISYARRRR